MSAVPGALALRQAGYAIKHTRAVGWWVDGRCGFLVAGYEHDKAVIVARASQLIAEAKAANRQPSWLIP